MVTGDRGASVALAQAFGDQGDMCSLSPPSLSCSEDSDRDGASVNEGLVFCDREEIFR